MVLLLRYRYAFRIVTDRNCVFQFQPKRKHHRNWQFCFGQKRKRNCSVSFVRKRKIKRFFLKTLLKVYLKVIFCKKYICFTSISFLSTIQQYNKLVIDKVYKTQCEKENLQFSNWSQINEYCMPEIIVGKGRWRRLAVSNCA